MVIQLEAATTADAAAIAALRLAASRDLTARFGWGTWSYTAESEGGVRMDLMSSHVFIARHEGTVVGTLRLATRSPWLGRIDFFSAAERPLYLTSMAVSPKMQRLGIGRGCLEAATQVAVDWGHDAIRLDAYDNAAGAGEFYRRCGFREVRRGLYNGTPLIYFEGLLSEATNGVAEGEGANLQPTRMGSWRRERDSNPR